MRKENKWYLRLSNWLVVILCVLLVPVLIINISIMIQTHSNKDVIPSVFGYKPFIVMSGSMETNIRIGDLIITKIVNPSDLKIDDVIAFRDEENTVTTHRIIDIVTKDGEDFFITKGDNNNTQDTNLVEYSDVEGIYVGRIPGVGKIMMSFSNPTTIIILFLSATVIFAVGFMISTKKERDKERQEFLEYKKQKEQEENKDNPPVQRGPIHRPNQK